MTPSRTILIGSAVPLLVLVGLVGFPPARIAFGLPHGHSAASTGLTAAALVAAIPAAAGGRGLAARQETRALGRLRRSLGGSAQAGFSGTEVITSWRGSVASTRLLALVQRSGGARTATAADGVSRGVSAAATTDLLTGLSQRSLAALAAGYDLRPAGTGRVAGRAATLVTAARNGHALATFWLDDQTGVLLREEVRDRTGQRLWTAAFRTFRPAPKGSAPTAAVPTAAGSVPAGSVPTGSVPAGSAPAAATGGVPIRSGAGAEVWTDVDLSALARWRTEGWPAPQTLPTGFVLIDARSCAATGGPTLQLTYSDGLTAISVFLQRGNLDAGALAGMTSQTWGDTVVHLRPGPPEVLVWQGGRTVITAVGDTDPDDLRSALAPLPRQPDRDTLSSVRHEMGSALAWFGG